MNQIRAQENIVYELKFHVFQKVTFPARDPFRFMLFLLFFGVFPHAFDFRALKGVEEDKYYA